jgi:hypothetical protein
VASRIIRQPEIRWFLGELISSAMKMEAKFSSEKSDFLLADYSACHLLSRWFLAELIFSTLKMEAICSSETSVDTQQTTRRYIPEECSLQL